MTFDEWYYVGNKCDTRFDDWTENRNRYYYCKEAWDYQQSRIDELEKEKLKMQDITICIAVEHNFTVNKLEKQLAEAVEIVRFYGDKNNWDSWHDEPNVIFTYNDLDESHYRVNQTAGKKARKFLETLESK